MGDHYLTIDTEVIMLRSYLKTALALICLLPCVLYAGPIDVNTATAEQLADSLQGVGPQKAEAIIAYREQHGPFRNVQDLTKVKGIGASLLDKNKGLIILGETKPAAQ